MKSIELKDYQINQLKEDVKGRLKDSLRICEFTDETHQSKGCLYSHYFDTEKEAEEYFEDNKDDDDSRSFIGTAKEILDKIDEFDEIVY